MLPAEDCFPVAVALARPWRREILLFPAAATEADPFLLLSGPRGKMHSGLMQVLLDKACLERLFAEFGPLFREFTFLVGVLWPSVPDALDPLILLQS